MNGHNDTDTKAAEKIDQNHFVQCTRREKFDGRVNAWPVLRHHKGNAVRRVHCSEIRIVLQTGCFAGQSWFGSWCGTGPWRNTKNRPGCDDHWWLFEGGNWSQCRGPLWGSLSNGVQETTFQAAVAESDTRRALRPRLRIEWLK
uniref:Uncharacterized protein n=1 Tax=Romanomermis culicivorax TaxID=13658 RepID=A0A915JSE4_ROMCU